MCLHVVSDIIISAQDGWIICPYCHKKLQRISQETEAKNLPIFCMKCKRELIVKIVRRRDQSA